MTSALLQMIAFLWGTQAPSSWSLGAAVIGFYTVHLLVTSIILYVSARLCGAKMSIISGISRAILVNFARDIIVVPLFFLTFFIPFFGVIVGVAIWFCLVKYIFNISWISTALTIIVSILFPTLLLIFVIIPIGLIIF